MTGKWLKSHRKPVSSSVAQTEVVSCLGVSVPTFVQGMSEDFIRRPWNSQYGMFVYLSTHAHFFFFFFNWVPVWPEYALMKSANESLIARAGFVSETASAAAQDPLLGAVTLAQQRAVVPATKNQPPFRGQAGEFLWLLPFTCSQPLLLLFSDVQTYSESAMVWL